MSQNIPVQQQMSRGAVGKGGVRSPCPLCWLSPIPWGIELGPMPSGQPMPLQERSTGNVRPLCHGEKRGGRWSFAPAFCFQLGLQNVGIIYQKGGYQLCLIPGIIATHLGNHDSLHVASKVTCPHCKWLKSTLLDLLWIYHRFTMPRWRAKHANGLQVMSSFLSVVKSVLIHSDQRQISLFNDSGLPLVSRGL